MSIFFSCVSDLTPPNTRLILIEILSSDDDDVTKQKKAAQQKASSPVQHIKKFTAKALERSQVAKFGAISPSIMKSAPMKELRKRTNEARTKLSSAATINIATTLFEFILLNSHIWSWDGFYEYNVSFPAAIDSSITYPSLGQFQTYKGKWEPILFWAAISVIIPLIGSFLLMFAKKNFDPFSFAMIKLALVSYFFAEPTATDSVVDIVQNAIGSNLMKISATTSLGFALYEAVMSK